MPEAPHDEMIKRAAEEILVPLGMFRKGRSRSWFDDQGWFLIHVEFQPSAYSKGAYLNAGISFLWDRVCATDNLYMGIGGREKAHIGYTGNDEDFYRQIVKMTEHAKNRVLHYRKFADPEFCKKHMASGTDTISPVLEYWNEAMLRFFMGDAGGREFLQRIVTQNGPEAEIERIGGLCAESRDLLTTDDAYLMRYVRDSIQMRRALLMKKAGFKKLGEWDAP